MKQVWYADDAKVQGRVKSWDSGGTRLNISALHFGYYPNSTKTYQIVKEEHENKAKAL